MIRMLLRGLIVMAMSELCFITAASIYLARAYSPIFLLATIATIFLHRKWWPEAVQDWRLE